MPSKEPEKGDKVHWNWGSGAPGGTVAETKHEGEIAIKSKKGNTIKKNADENNPAVHISRSGNDIVKRASELKIDKKASGSGGGGGSASGQKKDSDEKKQAGDKRKAPSQEADDDHSKKANGKSEPPKKATPGTKTSSDTKDKKEANKGKTKPSKEKPKPLSNPQQGETVSSRTRSHG